MASNRANWTQEEDELLCELANLFHAKQWSIIERRFNSRFGEKERTCKQLRERFKNYLQYEKGKALVKEWSPEEEKLLFREYLEIGSKWTQISRALPGKSEAYIKNKFYGGLRKALRRINEIRKHHLAKFSKPIKYSSLIRVLEIKEKSSTLPLELRDHALALRQKIVFFSQRTLTFEDAEDIMKFCEELFKFNFSSRCYRVKKASKKPLSNCDDRSSSEEGGRSSDEECASRPEDSSPKVAKSLLGDFSVLPCHQEKLSAPLPRKSSAPVPNEFPIKHSEERGIAHSISQQPFFSVSAFSPVGVGEWLGNYHLSLIAQISRLRGEEARSPHPMPPVSEESAQKSSACQ